MAFGGRRLSAVLAGLAVVLAAAVAGCAPAPQSAIEAPGIDFSTDEAANGAASQLGMKLVDDLAGLPGYAGMRIVRYGIEVSNVGTPSPEMRAAVARDAQRYQGSEIPVRFRSVRYTEQELMAVGRRLDGDRRYWSMRDIELLSWVFDVGSNKLLIRINRYLPATRDAFLARYGDPVLVAPSDGSTVGA